MYWNYWIQSSQTGTQPYSDTSTTVTILWQRQHDFDVKPEGTSWVGKHDLHLWEE